ncbi:MAG: hypothetical protein GKR89_15620 [Candidatus Latescibacteria bacterium]|nr:hypothetical protein [Candidatus Latescibacterota bacterium]
MRILLAALLTLGSTAAARAQVTPTFNLYNSYTDNLFQTYDKQSEWITQAYFDLGLVSTDNWSLYYTGNASLFSQYDDLFNHTHQAGVSYYRALGEKNALYGGAQLALRLDQALYDYRDFVRGEGYVQSKFYLQPTLLGRLGYVLGYQNYVQEPDYSFYEQEFSAQFSKFLPSRTTLQAGLQMGVKTYARAVEPNLDTQISARSGQERSLVQLLTQVKLAQSLGQGTGLQLEFKHRANVAGQSRPVDEALYNTDDDLFDDRYNYSGPRLRAGIKHYGPLEVELAIDGSNERRRYEGRPALDLDGLTVGSGADRRDRINSFSLGLQRPFYPLWLDEREVNLELEWLYRDVDSNDKYYSAQAQTFTLGVQVGF